MNIAAQRIESALNANTALQALVNGKHFWELAPDNIKGFYVAYRITENPGVTKNAKRSFEVTHWCYGRSLTQVSALSELVKQASENNGQYFLGAESGYLDNDTKEAFIKLIFKFNL